MGCDQELIGVSRALPPEDIEPGMHVAALYEVMEFAVRGCDIGAPEPARLVRLVFVATDERLPMKVAAVCLPFVMVEKKDGDREMLDVRRVRLARVSDEFAGAAKSEKLAPEEGKEDAAITPHARNGWKWRRRRKK